MNHLNGCSSNGVLSTIGDLAACGYNMVCDNSKCGAPESTECEYVLREEKGMNKIYFRKGGHPQSAGSNRMAELATELDEYKYHNAVVDEFKQLLEHGHIDELPVFFDKCDKYGVGLVGSRDYVYRGDKMKLLVNLALNGDLNVWKYFPRTLGFRDAMQKYCEAQDERT